MSDNTVKAENKETPKTTSDTAKDEEEDVAAKSKTTTKTVDQNNERELTTKEAYFASLNAWVNHANLSQNATAMFPYYLLNSYPQMFQNPAGGVNALSGAAPATVQSGTGGIADAQLLHAEPNAADGAAGPAVDAAAGGVQAPRAFSALRILDEQAQADLINSSGGYEYTLAPFWKRAVAETIDVLILLLLKVIATFMLMNLFDIDMGIELNKDMVRRAMDDEYTNLLDVSLDVITLSSDLLLIELIIKLLVCCYEAFWTTWHHGATPGKSLMKIRIQYVEAVLPLQAPIPPEFIFQPRREPVHALLYPAQTPGFKRAFMRAAVKTFIMTLLFPICVIMLFFKNNRTAYDILTKTVVVEANNNPNYRRQR